MNTEENLNEYSKKLFAKLFPNNEELANKHLLDILDEQEFLLQLEQLKHKLNIN